MEDQNEPFYTCGQIHFTCRNSLFVLFVGSVCLSVWHTHDILFVHSILKRVRKFIFWWSYPLRYSKSWCNSKIKSSTVKVTGNEDVQIVVALIVVKRGSIYVKPRYSDHRPILHISSNNFYQRKSIIFRYLSVFENNLEHRLLP